MRAVVQRVSSARVLVNAAIVGQIECGLVVLLAVTHTDTDAQMQRLADKLVHLRIFPDAAGRFDRTLQQVGGAMLVVSQFTLYGDTRKGRRPSFTAAADPAHAEPLIERFNAYIHSLGITVASGQFGAHMDVFLCNDGPVTLILDTAAWEHDRG